MVILTPTDRLIFAIGWKCALREVSEYVDKLEGAKNEN